MVPASASFSVGASHVLSVRHGQDQLASTRVDGVQVHERSMPLTAPVDRSWNFIGKNHYFSDGKPACAGFQGHIAEILLYSRSLDVAEQAGLESYLGEKWSVPLCPCDEQAD